MKQVLFRGDKVLVAEVPAPQPQPGQVLVRVAWSCLSPGTELAASAANGAVGLFHRLRHDPMAVRKAFNRFKETGLRRVTAIARERLTSCTPAGYSCAGTIVEVGSGVESFAPGARVACAGVGYANHAEFVAVPKNLVTAVPPGVDLADAATVALGAIALQGVRRAQVAVGESIGVIGLGLLGQLTVQLLKAAGCKVFGTDLDPDRVREAESFGVHAAPAGVGVADAAFRFTQGYGLDAVLITAATPSNEPLQLAMLMARRKGRVVVVGDVGLSAQRDAMYAKELDLIISTSYGPGRYDQSYEEDGLDYPYAYVRWTENRNMQAYLDLVAAGQVLPGKLSTRRLAITDAAEAYRVLTEDSPRPYTVLLEYPDKYSFSPTRHVQFKASAPTRNNVIRLAVVGAGSFARSVHLPNLRSMENLFRIEAVVTRQGPTAVNVAQQTGARLAGTDYREILADPTVDAVLIATRHHLHAEMVRDALQAGKNVFVEKPLAVTEAELEALKKVVDDLAGSPSGCPVVFVGFNRRYSPYAVRLRQLVAGRSAPLHALYRMNAGYVPPEHWIHGVEGGGRLIGEACHVIDLFRFLVGAPAVQVHASGLHTRHRDVLPSDNFTSTVRYTDGSLCSLVYTAQGGQSLPKEALEIHVDGWSCLLSDYRSLQGFGIEADLQTRRQEKGHREELAAFHRAITGALDGQVLWNEAVEVSRVAFAMDRQVRSQETPENVAIEGSQCTA